MDTSSNTEKRVAHILEGMRKAMPEIKRQIKVYERNLRGGNHNKSPKVMVHSKNV